MTSPWLPQSREHTFKATKRTAQITDAPNVYEIFADEEIAPHLADFQSGTVDPAIFMRIAEEVARSMMVRPRILGRGDSMPIDQDPEDPDVVPYSALYSSEIDELAEIWSELIQKAARFLGDNGGARASENGEDVGSDAKPRPRAKSRKRASVAD